MKALAVPVVFAITIVATAVFTCHAAAKPRVGIAQAERCLRLGCWPKDLPLRETPVHGDNVRPALLLDVSGH
jgi:hypothetical protein